MALSPRRIPPSPGLRFCSYTPGTFYFATDFSDQKVIYKQVPKDWAESFFMRIEEQEHISARKNYNPVTKTLWIRKMPTEIHDCHQGWIVEYIGMWTGTGLLTPAELQIISVGVGTTTKFLQGPYKDARKEPDLLVKRKEQHLPVFVIESGWSESLPRLRDDMNLWLVGGNGDVKATLIVIWQGVGSTNQVRGSLEFYTLDPNGMPILHQREIIFPAPPPQQAQAQVINLTRQTLLGGAVLPGINPNDLLTLELDSLRRRATDCLAEMGLVPA